jgi:hypothetical protein
VNDWIMQYRITSNPYSENAQDAAKLPRELQAVRDRLAAKMPTAGRREPPQQGIKLGQLARAFGGVQVEQIPREEWEKRYGNLKHTGD